jgi:hypothetical protein
LGTINIEKKVKHFGFFDEGDCFVIVGYRNSDESESKGRGEEENNTP